METFFYWAEVLNSLRVVLTVMTFICALVGGIAFLIWASDEEERVLKAVRAAMSLALALGILATVIPSKQTLYLMKGGALVEQVMQQSEDAKELPENTLKFINEYLKKQTEELKKK